MPTTVTDPLVRTQYLIARSATFRTWCGITSGLESAQLAAALARTHLLWVAADGLSVPFATVEYGEWSAERLGTGGGTYLRNTSVVTTFYAERTEATEAAAKLELLTFAATVQTIIDEMLVLSGASTHIEFAGCRRLQHPFALKDEHSEQWLIASYEWTGPVWGSQSE